MLRSALTVFLAAVLTVLLAGCISVYRMEIAQGNIVTPEQVDQLKLGMTRSQVRFVLGTPLVTDSFHPDRWDYYYSRRKSGDDKADTHLLTVFFKDDALQQIEGGVGDRPAGK